MLLQENEEIKELNVRIQRGFFDRKKRQLVITPEFVQFEDKSGESPFTTFKRGEISGYRYGINWIRGYKFTFGREYVVYIQNSSSDVLKINFRSFYGIKRKEYHHLYINIQNTLWDFYFGQIGGKLIAQFNIGEPISIGRAVINRDGVIVDEGGMLNADKELIPWNGLKIKEYYTYLAIYSAHEAAKINATFSFLKDWNTVLLFSVVKRILQDKEPDQNEA